MIRNHRNTADLIEDAVFNGKRVTRKNPNTIHIHAGRTELKSLYDHIIGVDFQNITIFSLVLDARSVR